MENPAWLQWILERPNLAAWVQALGTLVALFALVFEVFRRNGDRKKEQAEHRAAMARSVEITSSLKRQTTANRFSVTYKVKNFAAYPVHDLKVVVPDWDDSPAAQPHNVLEIVVGTLLPNESDSDRDVEVKLTSTPGAFRFYNGPAQIEFVDVWGQPWRAGAGLIEKMDHMPRVC